VVLFFYYIFTVDQKEKIMQFKEWEKIECIENIQVSRLSNRSVYRTPNGVEIYEDTYVPYSVFKSIRITQRVILTISENEKELVEKYGGSLTDVWYGTEDQRWALFIDDLESAFNFAMEQKECILRKFKESLK
jgi:hypothetical protein